jgi:hypothetical protein
MGDAVPAGIDMMLPPVPAAEAARVQAVAALTELRQLTRSSVHAWCDAEIASIVHVTQLQHLHLSFSDTCSTHFLVQLGVMRNLQLLQVQAPLACFEECEVPLAGALLSSLEHVARFELCLVVHEQEDPVVVLVKLAFDDAKQWLADCGLSGPAEVAVVTKAHVES